MIKLFHPFKSEFYIEDNPNIHLALILGKIPLLDIEYSKEGKWFFVVILALGIEFNWL